MKEVKTISLDGNILNFSLYKNFVRPILFRYRDPEIAHEKTKPFFAHEYPLKLLAWYLNTERDRLKINLGGKVQMGGIVSNAAGWDKDCEMLPGASHVFDYLTPGTFLPYSNHGHPRPRSVRDVPRETLYNKMGFPFKGPTYAISKLENYNNHVNDHIPINVSVSVKPLESDDQLPAISQLMNLVKKLVESPPVRMYEFNFSSPNTKGLQVFLEHDVFDDICERLEKVIPDSRLKFLKLPPYTESEGRERTLDIIDRWADNGGDGVTLVNTLPVEHLKLPNGSGGMSGRPLYPIALQNLKDVNEQFKHKKIIKNACGGIWPENVAEVLEAGADTLQFLTPLIYEGLGMVRKVKKEIVKYLDQHGYNSLRDLGGHCYR